MKKHEKLCYYILTTVIMLTAIFLHTYKLATLPTSLNVDEAGLWYNVRCLLNWGIDQKGNSWPVLFANIWGEQSPAYTYLAFICCKIFGQSLFAIRLPAVINTTLTMVFGLLIVDKIFKNKKINLLYLGLFLITPYFTIISKMALDCNLMLGFSTVFLYCFLKSLETRNVKWYFVAGITCGLTFYTYALSYFMIPVFLIFSLVYLVIFKKITVKEVVMFFIPAFILGLPLLMVQLVNILGWEEFQLLGITFTKFDTVRNGEFAFSVSNIIFNLTCSLIYVFKGLNGSIYNVPCGYLLYPTSVFILFGIVFITRDFIKSLKTKEFKEINFVLFWAVSVVLVVSILNGGRDVYQQCAIYFAYLIFAIYAIIAFFEMIKHTNAKKAFAILLLITYFVSFAYWGHFYFVKYDEFASETKLMADVVPDELNELDGQTYFLKHYVYYQATYCIEPSEFNATDNKPFLYKNIIFNDYLLQDTLIDESCNYVIYYKDFEKIGYLDGYDFDVEQIGSYLFYKTKALKS